jgi:hypothetical protein
MQDTAANALNSRSNIYFRRCHSRATMKNLTINDLETLVTTQDFQKQVDGYGLTTALYAELDVASGANE